MIQTNLGHVMVDIETMGHNSNSVICSIAAMEFDISTGKTGRSFYEKISIQSCLNAGLKVDGSTIEWWLKQNNDSRTEISNGQNYEIVGVLYRFTDFINQIGAGDLLCWANSPRFDLGLLKDAYNILNYPGIPWNYYNERDVRTLASLRPQIKKDTPFIGTPHNPLDDCLHQITYCHKIWIDINSVSNEPNN